MSGRYENLGIANIRLHNIAKLAQGEGRPNSARSILWRQLNLFYGLDEIDEKGIVRVSKDLFAEAMDEEPIEAARIRECAICNRIFLPVELMRGSAEIQSAKALLVRALTATRN